MNQAKSCLFITWDSPESNYLESLFFPILSGLKDRGLIKPYILQFSWASKEEVSRIKKLAQKAGIKYFHVPVQQFSPRPISAWWTLWKSKGKVLDLIRQEKIDVLMPRSTMPAWLVKMIFSELKKKEIKIVFDADGLPIQERIDFSGLKNESFQFKMLQKIEGFLLQNSDWVLVRTNRSIEYHLKNNPSLSASKFSKVINGRDSSIFQFDFEKRIDLRRKYNIGDKEILMAHTGSLGGAYHLKPVFEMLQQDSRLKLMLLTRQDSLAESLVPADLKDRILILGIPFDQVPNYLSAADIGICLRKPAPSIQGISPIKLGEYLLMGLPVLVNPEIGDVVEDLADLEYCFLWSESRGGDFFTWLENLKSFDSKSIRNNGVRLYSLDASLDTYQKALNW